jgi:hypothetical protein
MRSTHLIPTTFVMAVLACLGCKPSLTVDAPEIDITEKNLAFPGVVSTVAGTQSATASFKVVTSKLGAAANPDSSAIDRIERMEITRITVNGNRGVTSFSFLESLNVSAANYDPTKQSSSGKPVVTILDCNPSSTKDCPLLYENIGATLDFPLNPPVDLIPLWANTNLYIIITASGTVPKVDWSVDVTFSLSVRWSS